MEQQFDRSVMRVLRYFSSNYLSCRERGVYTGKFFEIVSEGADLAVDEAQRCTFILEREGLVGETKIVESVGGSLYRYGITDKGMKFLEEQRKKTNISKGIPYVKIRRPV